jgi:hypothetical protein
MQVHKCFAPFTYLVCSLQLLCQVVDISSGGGCDYWVGCGDDILLSGNGNEEEEWVCNPMSQVYANMPTTRVSADKSV